MARTLPPGPRNGLLGLHHVKELNRDILAHAKMLRDTYGDAAYFRIGSTGFYQFTHPDQVHATLVAKAKKLFKPTRLKQVFGKWDGQGLVTSDGDLWVRQRRLVQRAFQPSRMNTYAQAMSRLAWRMCDGWGPQQTLDINEAFNRLTVAIVAETLFGVNLDEIAGKLKGSVDAIQRLAMRDLSAAVPRPLWWNKVFDREGYRAIKLLDDLVWKLIHERRASGEDRGDLLSILLLAVDDEGDGQGMSDRQARDEIMTLLLAGHESTAVTLTWTAYLLAKHPPVQEELACQVQRELEGRPPLLSDLAKLPALERVIKESQRLYPAVYFMSREVHEPVEIGGYALPKGAQIHLVPYLVHHDERWWPEPDRFDPDRFLPEREAQQRPLAYFPFGAGPRGCIGKSFALMEAQLILASILQRYHLSLPAGQPDPVMETQVSLHPKDGLQVVVRARATIAPLGGVH